MPVNLPHDWARRILRFTVRTAFLLVLASDAAAAVVEALHFEGVTAISETELRGRMLTAGPGWKPWVPAPEFDADSLEADLERIADAYREHGYHESVVQSQLEWGTDHTEVEISVLVEEGEPVRVESWTVEITPHPLLSDADRLEVLDGLPLAPGEVFGASRYRSVREELLRRLAERGFPMASLDGGAEIELAVRSARVAWSVQPGPRVRFGASAVEGLDRVDADLVERELDFSEGDVFSLASLERSRESIYALDLFRSVILEPERGPAPAPADEAETHWPIRIRVEERKPRSIRIGLGFGTEDLLRVSAQWKHRNFFGQARSLEFTAKYSSLLAGVEGTFRQPRFLDPATSLALNASAFRETTPSFDARRVGVSSNLRRPLSKHWTGRLGWELEQTRISHLKTDFSVGEEPDENVNLSVLEFGAEYVNLYDRVNPRDGTRLDLSLRPSLRAIASDVDYLKARAEVTHFIPLDSTVLALRLLAANISPWGSTDESDVPLVRRLFSGGSTSVRGFDYQRLGPLDDDENPRGGLSLVEGNVELRFPIWRDLGGVTFLDAGQLSARPTTFRLGDVFYATGGGLRYGTPLGPLRLDLGYIINPPPDIGRLRVHFSVGHAF